MQNIKTFVLYLGYPRSGSTISCKSLSLHKNINIANQKHIISNINNLNSFNDIIKFIGMEKSIVYGTKDGNVLLEYLIDYPYLLNEFKLKIPKNVDLKFLHVIRNPYDNISSWVLKLKKGLKKNHGANISEEDAFNCACTEYRKLNEKILELKNTENILSYKHEEFIKNRRKILRKICNFFDVEFYEIFDNEVKNKLYDNPNVTRKKINFTEERIRKVTNIKNNFEWLKDYKF